MRVYLKNSTLIAIISSILMLTGCFNQQTPAEKMYVVMEKVVTAEKGFEDQQDPLVELEMKEKVQYDQIMALGMKQYEKVVKIADEAIKNSLQRKAYMNVEQKSLKESEMEFKKTGEFIKDIDDDQLRNKAKELYKTMMTRYKTHAVLYREYMTGIAYDQELYRLFEKQNVTLDELQSEINKINSTYKKIYAANNQFNELTLKYNKEKLSFYEIAGIKIDKSKSK
ncbi:MAG: YkyA family protein [Bacillota bacterium]|nr:YkyA family protein [Bacillota bacterium]